MLKRLCENYEIMSWDSYVDNIISRSNENCDRACLIGRDGSVWTTGHEKAIKLSADEIQKLVHCYNSGDFDTLKSNGVFVEGQKYQFLRCEDNVILAKMRGCGALTIECSSRGIIIGHTKEGCHQGNVNTAVAAIASYLKSIDY
ncbi:hypothetical protein ACF0H5_009988 [Mactra antiquata]